MTYTVAGYKALHGERRVVSPYITSFDQAVRYLADLSKDGKWRRSLVVTARHYRDSVATPYSYECPSLHSAIQVVDGLNYLDGWYFQIEWL